MIIYLNSRSILSSLRSLPHLLTFYISSTYLRGGLISLLLPLSPSSISLLGGNTSCSSSCLNLSGILLSLLCILFSSSSSSSSCLNLIGILLSLLGLPSSSSSSYSSCLNLIGSLRSLGGNTSSSSSSITTISSGSTRNLS